MDVLLPVVLAGAFCAGAAAWPLLGKKLGGRDTKPRRAPKPVRQIVAEHRVLQAVKLFIREASGVSVKVLQPDHDLRLTLDELELDVVRSPDRWSVTLGLCGLHESEHTDLDLQQEDMVRLWGILHKAAHVSVPVKTLPPGETFADALRKYGID